MRSLSLSRVYQLLEPGPVVLLTTAHRGRMNVMAMSWHMMVEFEPPRVACVVSEADFSFAALRATGECVIAVPALARLIVPAQKGSELFVWHGRVSWSRPPMSSQGLDRRYL